MTSAVWRMQKLRSPTNPTELTSRGAMHARVMQVARGARHTLVRVRVRTK